MPLLRQDPATRDWVIIATERAKRPDEFRSHQAAEHLPRYDPHCPFCAGNEASTPPEEFAIRNKAGHWRVRVCENRFYALSPREPWRPLEEGFFREASGYGKHEVIVETPRHDQPMALMSRAQVADVLRAYRSRYLALHTDPHLQQILIFQNHGPVAGTSLAHPHSQLIATPVTPAAIRLRHQIATQYFDDTGQCLYCTVRNAELKDGRRVVLENDGFVAIHPFASRRPFETWILPKQHGACFARLTDAALVDLAEVLRLMLRKLYVGLGNPDYNCVVQTAPIQDEDKDYFLWHLQILPRLNRAAGFELGSGMFINTALPEETAAFIRKVEV
jgi:UDPglucose--hexose-1-phosphate uridylyltransferase